MTSGPPSGGGNLPLQEFRRDVPPGWQAGDPAYPLRLYLEKLQLWYRTTNLDDEIVGPMVAGRLHGRAAKVAMMLRVPRPDGGYDVGPEALARLSVDEVLDPNTGAVIQQPIASGVQYLLMALRSAFGQQDQDLATTALDRFFSLTRAGQKLSLAEYAVEFDSRYEEASERAGLQLNDVGKFYLFFRGSSLPSKTIDDLKLQVGGDYTRYQDARSLALRLNPNVQSAHDSDIFYEEHYIGDDEYGNYYADEDAWWYGYGDGYDDDGSWYPEEYVEGYDDYGHYYEGDGDQEWYGEGADEAHEPYPQQPEGEEAPAEDPNQEIKNDYYKGKAKGKGGEDGCFNCGSKWHMARDCPLQGQRPGKGKGSGKPYGGGRKGGGKFRGKGYGWRPAKGKGKGKSKGFGKNYGKSYGKFGSGSKGYGKRHWFADTTLSPARPTLDFSEGIPDASTTTSFHTTSTAVKKPETFVVHTSSSEEEFTWLKRPAKTAASSVEPATSDVQSEYKKKNVKFEFAVFHADQNQDQIENYFSVRGEQRHGLLIDPGAASGLIGTDTLKELIARCIDPLGRKDEVILDASKSTPVSGINGEADHTLGEVTLPLMAGGLQITYKAEVINERTRIKMPCLGRQSYTEENGCKHLCQLVQQR